MLRTVSAIAFGCDVKGRLAASGAETVTQERATLEALRVHLKGEIDRWGPTIRKRA